MDRKTFLTILAIIVLIAVLLLVTYKPSKVVCTNHNAETCPAQCVVCPPCAVCSSTSCQTEEFCNSIGFDRSWYGNIQSRLE